MPRSKEQNEKIRKEKRKIILENATLLFSKSGYDGTTTADIAKAAKVSFGSVFHYFSTKDELFRACVLEPLDDLRAMFILTIEDDPLIQIIQAVKNHVHTFAHMETYLRLVQLVLMMPERFEEIFIEITHFSQQFIDQLTPLVEAGQQKKVLLPINPELVTLSYLSFLNGIRVTTMDPPEGQIWNMYVEQAIRLFGPVDHSFTRLI